MHLKEFKRKSVDINVISSKLHKQIKSKQNIT